MKTVLLLVCLSGCITPTLQADCLTFTSNHMIDRPKLARNVRLARQVLGAEIKDLRYGIYYPIVRPFIAEERFCQVFQNNLIIIREEAEWVCHAPTVTNPTGECVGLARENGEIEVSYSTNALVHELIHQWDRIHGESGDDAFNHVNWTESGRRKMDQEYTDRYEKLPPPVAPWP